MLTNLLSALKPSVFIVAVIINIITFFKGIYLSTQRFTLFINRTLNPLVINTLDVVMLLWTTPLCSRYCKAKSKSMATANRASRLRTNLRFFKYSSSEVLEVKS